MFTSHFEVCTQTANWLVSHLNHFVANLKTKSAVYLQATTSTDFVRMSLAIWGHLECGRATPIVSRRSQPLSEMMSLSQYMCFLHYSKTFPPPWHTYDLGFPRSSAFFSFQYSGFCVCNLTVAETLACSHFDWFQYMYTVRYLLCTSLPCCWCDMCEWCWAFSWSFILPVHWSFLRQTCLWGIQ